VANCFPSGFEHHLTAAAHMINPFFPAGHATFTVQYLIGGVVLYVYVAYTQMVLARRLGILMRDAWLAWLPFANIYLLTKMAIREWWYMLGIFIPYVNIFVVGFLWSEASTRLGKNPWIGAAVVLPYIGILVPGYLVITTPPIVGPSKRNAVEVE